MNCSKCSWQTAKGQESPLLLKALNVPASRLGLLFINVIFHVVILCRYITNIIFTTIFGMAEVSLQSECCQPCWSCAGDLRGNWFSLSVYWTDSTKMNASEAVLQHCWLLDALFLTQMIHFVLQWHPLESRGVWIGLKRKLAHFPLCISQDHELPYFTAAWEMAFSKMCIK